MSDDPRVLVVGETLIDFVPETMDSLGDVDQFYRRAGGAPANVAVGLTQLAEPPWFWTRLGCDEFGDFLARTLKSYGVPSRFVQRDDVAKTTLAFIGEGSGDEPMFSFYREGTADTRFESGTVPAAVLDTVEYIYFGGVVLSTEPSRSAIFELLNRARRRDCRIVFDPNTRPELWTDTALQSVYDRAFGLSDIVTASPADLTPLGWSGSDQALLDKTLAAGPHTVFLTKGDAGAIAKTTARSPWDAKWNAHKGFDVDVIDTTGAGDAFTAGILVELSHTDPSVRRALRMGNAVGAAATTATGGMAALPTMTDLTTRFPGLTDRC